MSNIGSATSGKITGSSRVTSKVGQLLQEARRQRGLEIKDIAASTHVRSEYLTALEEGRFSELPENVYTRNFLRLYAEAVGLDEQEVLEHYSMERYGKSDAPRKSVYPSPAYDTETESYVAAEDAAAGTANKRRGFGWIIPLIILGLLGMGSFFAWRNYVFPNDATGGYTLNLPFMDREFNIPSFNRSGAGSGETETPSVTLPDTNTPNLAGDASTNSGTTSGDADVTAVSDTASTDSGSTDSASTTGDAIEGSASGDGTGEVTLTVPDSGENAPAGAIVTPDSSVSSSGEATSTGNDAAGVIAVDVANTADATTTAEGNDAAGGFVLFSIATEPAGANVNIDSFDLGPTPISNFPITPSDTKELSVSFDGYETIEQSFDGTEPQEFFFTLVEASAGTGDITDVEGDATNVDSITVNSDGTVVALDDPSITPAAELQGKAVITIEDGGEAWLEVYQGTTRDGSTLVYRVANDEDRFEFDLPIVVRAGRSSLVKVSVNGGLAKPLGPVDEVAQQVFEQ